jgi:FkbM family methyltransferase
MAVSGEELVTTDPQARLQPERLIFDIGMNACEDTAFYLKKGFRVVAIEANPAMCRRAREMFPTQVDNGSLIILNYAIAEKPGKLTFYICNEVSAWSTASKDLVEFWSATANATFTTVDVPCLPIENALAAHGVPYYVKIDIEGSDLICLKGLTKSATVPRYVSFEVDFRTYKDAIHICESAGYNSFSVVPQEGVPTQQPPQPALEGEYIPYAFHKGCSGLFGRELPTPWVSARGMLSECNNIVWQMRAAGLMRKAASALGNKSLADPYIRSLVPRAHNWYDIHVRKI